jgi:hypothetical protein
MELTCVITPYLLFLLFSLPPFFNFDFTSYSFFLSYFLSLPYSYVQRRIHDAESLAATAIEAVRQDVAEAGTLLAEHVASFSTTATSLDSRIAQLERQNAQLAEAISGKFEALAAAIDRSAQWREEISRRDAAINSLQRELGALRALIASLGAVLPPELVSRWQFLQQQYMQHHMGGAGGGAGTVNVGGMGSGTGTTAPGGGTNSPGVVVPESPLGGIGRPATGVEQ